MSKFKIKETYLLLLIVLGLISLAFYTTFALFTASTTINDVVGITATLDIGKSLTEYEIVTVASGETKLIELNVVNSYSSNIYYGAWYQIIQGNSDDIDIGIYTEKNSNSSSGVLSSNSNINLLAGVTNNSESTIALYIGVKGSTTNELNLGANKILLPDGFSVLNGDLIINSFKIDGVETTTFPLSSGYNIDTSCEDANITFDYKSQRYKVSNITKNKNAKCGIKFTTKTSKIYLNNYIKSLADTTQGTGELVHEEMDYTAPTTVNYQLSQSQYGTISQYYSASYRSTSGTSVTNAFSFSNNVWTSNPSNLTSSKYYHIKFTVPENGYYQLCYTLSSGSTNNYLYIYNDDTQVNINNSSFVRASSSSSKSGCVDIGNLTTSNSLRVVQRAYTTIATSTFYLNKMNTSTTHYDTGYRYEGKNPNNYIYFNNELWRIIGVFDENSHGKTGEYLTKIIRNDYLGGYAWDKSGKNNWVTSSLYNLLNTNYYNATDGTSSGNCYQNSTTTGNCDYTVTGIQSDYRSMVENVTWYLGGKNGEGYTAEDFYTGERNSASVYSGNTASISNYIGLMYASDYGYSVLSSSCARTINLDSYDTSACGGSSWLKNGTYEWTITHVASEVSSFELNDDLCLNTKNSIELKYGNAIRPVLYIKSNTQKISGTGTISDPYIIGI